MLDNPVIYFDNAATSWPKPPAVVEAMKCFLEEVGGSPGRSGHRLAIAAARLLADARMSLAELFNTDDPSRIVFTKNVTEALNLAIQALVHPGDVVVTTAFEHNAVMRPLRYLETQGARLAIVPCSPEAVPDLDYLEKALRAPAKLLVTTHASNVTGALLPLAEMVALAHNAGVPVLVDAAQTAGAYPLDLEALDIDFLAFTGHKSLYGPTGTGGLCLREGTALAPLIRGGTGSASELEIQPDFLPDMLESGTLNIAGIVGLDAGVRFVLQRGVPAIARYEHELTARFLTGLQHMPGITVYGPASAQNRVGVVSFNIDGVSCSDLGMLLDHRYGIMSRIGLHCAPAAHRVIGTYPSGTVRFAWSTFTTAAEIDTALDALHDIWERHGSQ
jgi:cysteine desulfurase/selenocysteine lyase